MKKEKGFTLIELVIVLILLGFLAAVAVPKFVNLFDDAKKSAVKGAVASVRSAINIYYANMALKTGSAAFPPYSSLANLLNGPFPTNPINNLKTVKDDTSANMGATDSNYGWIYNEDKGQFWSAVTGGFGANNF